MAKIVAHAAILLARDVPATVAYWTQKLGFSVHGLFGEPPGFAILERDGARQMFGQVRQGQDIPVSRDRREGLTDAYFWVDDAMELHAEFAGRGAMIACAPEDMDYGVREFVVEDPNGYYIAFGQVLAGASEEIGE